MDSNILILGDKRIPLYDLHTGDKNPYLKEIIQEYCKDNKYKTGIINGTEVQLYDVFSGRINNMFS